MARARLDELEVEIKNLAANMLTGVVSRTISAMLEEREDEADRLRSHLARDVRKAPAVLPHPALRKRFEERVAALRESLSNPENREETAGVLASLIERAVIMPGRDGGAPTAEIMARYGKLVEFAHSDRLPVRRGRLRDSAVKVVAGTGFEPVTFRL